MQVQNIKHETNKQWFTEWYRLGLFLGASLVLIYLSWHFLSGFLQFIAIWFLYVATFVEAIIFIVRTIGVIMTLVFTDVKAVDIKFDAQKIDLILDGSKIDSYPWTSIDRIILSENLDGIYIHADNKTRTYQLPVQYKILEKNLDDILAVNNSISLKKEKQWVESNQTGLDPDKDPTNVKRTYMAYIGGNHSGTHGRSVERTVESVHGVETIYYSRQ